MIESKFLDYTFDEEQGFEAPRADQAEKRKKTPGETLGIALAALGTVAFLVQAFTGPQLGGWGSLLASYGAMGAGGLLYFLSKYRKLPAGIHHDDLMFGSTTGRGFLGWFFALAITGFYVILYFRDDVHGWIGAYPIDQMTRLVDPLAQVMRGRAADHWFLYGFLYTMCVLVFGARMFMRYRHNRYHLIRTGSVMFFQLVLAFVIPNVLILMNSKEYYFSYFWPLKPEYLYPAAWSSAQGVVAFFFWWSLVMSLVATPILTYLYGKRWYCSWVCGCGGLAETLGDPWRQLSSKTNASWRIERWVIHAVLILIVGLTVLLWVNSAVQGQVLGGFSQPYAKFYGLIIVSIFSGVVGVGFYPLLGSRVWCHFGCPMAAILGIIQRVKSRFRITTNGSQCMSCGNCSTYCEMGIDVRAYAQRQENIVRASCVGCGVCSAVCPRGVLKLENGPAKGRFVGDECPITTFLRDVKNRPEKHRPEGTPLP